MSFCVYPCVFYVQIELYKTLKKTSIDEIAKKRVLFGIVFSQKFLFVNPTVTYDFWVPTYYFVTAMIMMIIILVLFLRPKDFILKGNEVCPICRFIDTKCRSLKLNLPLTSRRSLGDEIHLHLNILHHCVWYFLLLFGNTLALICDKLLLGRRLRKEMHQESRVRHAHCVGLRLISLIVALPFIFVGGVFCLLILIVILIILMFYLSPLIAVIVFSMVKINRFSSRKLLWIVRFYLLYLIVTWVCFSFMLLTNSCLFVSNVVAYTIIGLALNVSIVTPILAFILVLTTNVYLCYAIMQSKYRESQENDFGKDARIPVEQQFP